LLGLTQSLQWYLAYQCRKLKSDLIFPDFILVLCWRVTIYYLFFSEYYCHNFCESWKRKKMCPMRNLRDNRRRCRRWDQKTSWRHFCSVDVAEKIMYIFLQDFSKKKTLSIPASCRFFIRKTD
jgi:hypothetical protein